MAQLPNTYKFYKTGKISKWRKTMQPKDYIVAKIEGEYAYLREIDGDADSEIFIALALLPLGTDVGTKLHYEMLEYTVI